MRIEILYFAAARERVGQADEIREVPEGTSVRQLIDQIMTEFPALDEIRAHVRIALDEDFVDDEDIVLNDGSTIALIPPVSGGLPNVSLQHNPIDARVVEALVMGPDRGALVTFCGAVRDQTGEHSVQRLEYEAYEPMALKVLGQLCDQVEAEFPGVRVAVHHRLGILSIGEYAVVAAVSAPHRADAFKACIALMDLLKADVPIFKKEVRGDGSVWVGLGP